MEFAETMRYEQGGMVGGRARQAASPRRFRVVPVRITRDKHPAYTASHMGFG